MLSPSAKGLMADPLSITASAAGLVSLAITVCRSLAKYYDSWKSYRADIEKLCQCLEIVLNNMRHLQICINNHDFSPALKQQVEEAILACAGDISVLDSELGLIKGIELQEGRQGKLRTFVQKAQYPFKEETLRKVKTSVFWLHASVDLAVGILGM